MKVKVKIQGLTSLLMNRFNEGAEVSVGSGVSTLLKGSRGTPRQQAEAKAYKDQAGNLYIPGPNVFSCLMAGGIFHKVGKRQLTSRDTSLIPAGCLMDDLICPLNTKEWEVDSRSVVNPSTKGRRMCYRPRLDEWKLSFTLSIDLSVFDPKLIRLVLDDSGKKIGLGDFRPSRKGPFGKFVVIEWRESFEPGEKRERSAKAA